MSKINGPFWAITYKTESGDEGFYGVFNEEPTDEHFMAIAMEDFPDEVIEEENDEGETIRSLYIYFRAHEIESIVDLPEPVEV
ncbi:hypothetical protein CcrC1_gp093 [Caulobacter phage C1]|nr:hypothetical protein CcrC1_gp093 [Caulobacter phage C1]UTU08321.1 hypothetical protein CcrC2_gp093 [Caulobacter phage C2]UTU08842.1 hypothetical protein CcrJ4_gp091 [Caulobacter phage J4]UTU09395.1 hypothetical protein CcrBL47_gp109 [Caulobacter phage BL47]UTU09955.1 hypothetical protein CcrRB23_gp093 [Caulobacter phage RB23]WGN96980.1 hypothetical protein [Bertelyvirus sp.]